MEFLRRAMGASAMTWETWAGGGVGQDLTQACPFHEAHVENIRGERLFDPEPKTLKAKTLKP